MALSRVLLMNDARLPWLILVPRREGLVELIDLDAADRMQLIEEATRASRFLKAHAGADKINVGALGNIVRQLHVHVVARSIGDTGWPGPVWGHGAAASVSGRRCAGVDRRGEERSRTIAAAPRAVGEDRIARAGGNRHKLA